MSLFSSLAPAIGMGLGALLAAPTGGMSLGMGAMLGGMAGSVVGNSMAGDEALKAQQDANSQNIQFAQSTNAKEIELANTAHQREVADLKAAGLNPILSARLGGSATPSLTSPQMQSLAPTILQSAKQGADTMSSFGGMYNQLALQKSQVELNSANATAQWANANLSNTRAMGEAIDNARAKAELPANVVEAANSQYKALRRWNRPDEVKNRGIDMEDAGKAALGWVNSAVDLRRSGGR